MGYQSDWRASGDLIITAYVSIRYLRKKIIIIVVFIIYKIGSIIISYSLHF